MANSVHKSSPMLQTNGNDQSMFVIEGALTDLHYELGTENLLQKIDKHYRERNVISGLGAVAGDLYGQAANSAALAMYDGEDTQNFICLINGQVVCGQFGGAEMLPQSSKVKAVVTRQNDVLVAHAIMYQEKGLLWIHHPWGTRAEMLANFKLAWWLSVFTMTCISLCILFLGTGSWGAWETFFKCAVTTGAIGFGMALWANKDMNTVASPSTTIFRLLGFAKPENANLNSYSLRLVESKEFGVKGIKPPSSWFDMGTYQHRNVFCYRKALEDGALRLEV